MKLISAAEAAELVKNGDTLFLGGFGGCGICESVIEALRERFLRTGEPRDLTLFKIATLGVHDERGAGRLIELPGMVHKLFSSNNGAEPTTQKAVADNRLLTYLVPMGTACYMLSNIAAQRPGFITKTGLGTMADPAFGGSKSNTLTEETGEDVVSTVTIEGEEYLYYRTFPVQVSLIKASAVDEDGNLFFDNEPVKVNVFEAALAAHNSGGIVIAQADCMIPKESRCAHDAYVHGSLVDYVVVEKGEQILSFPDKPEYVGKVYSKEEAKSITVPLNERKVCARRALLSLPPDKPLNIGVGMPEYLAAVLQEEGIAEKYPLTVESGIFGGTSLLKAGFGAAVNPASLVRVSDMFNAYDGGYLKATVLGAAQIDAQGNVNVTGFGKKKTGPGGFIDITQFTPFVIFLCSFTVSGLEAEIGGGRFAVRHEGKVKKFVRALDQISFSAAIARRNNKKVLYVTERAVFEMTKTGIRLIELAPGADLERDVLAQMEFVPEIAAELKTMDERLFHEEKMGLREP